jgi:hypothetical protein
VRVKQTFAPVFAVAKIVADLRDAGSATTGGGSAVIRFTGPGGSEADWRYDEQSGRGAGNTAIGIG